MGKKERRAALEFILDNEVIVRKISEAMGCDPAMKNRERKNLIEDMIKSYRKENIVEDAFVVNILGNGKPPKRSKDGIFSNKNYRNDNYDDYEYPKFKTRDRVSEDISDRFAEALRGYSNR